MSFWNYIGEFLLFRWLLGKFRKSTTEHDSHTEVSGASINGNSEYLNGNLDEGIAPDDAITDVGNNLLDDSDNSEELDDLDIFIRNNNGNNRSYPHHRDFDCDYHSSGHRSSHNDWSSGSCSQSYDDFHDEQDDYDMMDDDF
jgi:hypothetical protein